MHKFFLVGLVTVLLSGILFVCIAGQKPAVTMIGDFDGNDWRQLPAAAREFYVGGYLHGYSEGFTEACHAAETISSVREVSSCLQSHKTYSKLPLTLARQISEFYDAYPEHRAVKVLLLVTQFSDQDAKSPKEIHELLRAGKPL
jgi:hypothetical protein